MDTTNEPSRADENRHPHTSLPHRFKQPPIETLLKLGPLALLAGQWTGAGFNVIWPPTIPEIRRPKPNAFFNLTKLSKHSPSISSTALSPIAAWPISPISPSTACTIFRKSGTTTLISRAFRMLARICTSSPGCFSMYQPAEGQTMRLKRPSKIQTMRTLETSILPLRRSTLRESSRPHLQISCGWPPFLTGSLCVCRGKCRIP